MNDVPEGFKMTELGTLPEEWKVVNLGDVFEFSRKPRGVLKEDTEIPFIPMEFISEDCSRISGWQMKKVSEISSGSFVIKNDLVIAKITPSFENGKQAILDNLPETYGYATTEIWAIHPKNESATAEYLYNYLKIPPIRADLASKMEGSTGRQRLPRHVLKNLQLPLPPLSQQQAIVNVLSTVQEAREKTEAEIEFTKELKKSLMKHLFTYGPVPLQEANKVPLKETEIGLVPEGWDVASLGESAEIVSGGTPSRKNPEYWNGDIPWVKTGEVNYCTITRTEEKISKIGLEKSSARIIPSGSLLLAMYGQGVTRGRVSILGIDAAINQACAAIFPFKNIYTHFLFYVFSAYYQQIRDLGHGAHQKNLSATIIKTIMIPVPPLPEQQQIARILSSVDRRIEALENKKRALEALFQTLLQDLMTAKIRVNHMEMAQ